MLVHFLTRVNRLGLRLLRRLPTSPRLSYSTTVTEEIAKSD